LGRPGPAAGPALRPRHPDGGGPGHAVRLQQRLPDPARPPGRPGSRRARGQPRVHQRAVHARPVRRERPDARADRDRVRRARTERRHGRPGPRDRPHHTAHGPDEPADHGADADGPDRPRRRRRTGAHQRRPGGAHRAGHALQLLRRSHPVEHGAHRRGELRRLLRQRRDRRRPGVAERAGPLRDGPGRLRAQVGDRRRPFRADPRAQRGEPLRLGRRDRSVRPRLDAPQAHRARALQARGGQSAGLGHRGAHDLHGRRREVRVRLQVRRRRTDAAGVLAGRPGGQRAPARRGHPLRRPGSPATPPTPPRRRPAPASSTAPASGCRWSSRCPTALDAPSCRG